MTTAQIVTVIVFAGAYLYLIFSNRHMATVLWGGVILLWLLLGLAPALAGHTPMITPLDMFMLDRQTVAGTASLAWRSINWNVIGITAGTLILAEVFIWSRVPAVLSDLLIDRSPNVCCALLGVCAIASFISVFAANVATVLIVAPIAIELARKLKTSPAPFLIGIAICSNLQGTATLIGDPPSMLIAAQYKLNFNDFFWHNGRPGIFFAVQVGALASFAVLWLIFRKYRQPVARMPVPALKSWVPTILLCAMIAGLALGSLADADFLWFGGAVCLACGFAAVGWLWRRNRPAAAPAGAPQGAGYEGMTDRQVAAGILKSYDWSSTCFLMGVFLMVRAMVRTGVVQLAADWVGSVTGSSALLAFVIIVVFSTALSAFVDNIPYIAVMLPLVMQLETGVGGQPGLGRNMVLAYGLLLGSCLGGNITPVGASANVVAYGMLRKMGEKTTFWDFVKIGLPFTLAATAAAGAFVWMVCMWFS
jgi:Na+/H+ antiporter NhaD/arsenite permease-like protein